MFEEQTWLMITEEGKLPIHDSRWFVMPEDGAIDDHACLLVNVPGSLASRPLYLSVESELAMDSM